MDLTDKLLQNYLTDYRNEEAQNDDLFRSFTFLTDQVAYLKSHRDYIEEFKLGFGDRAFHYMWYLLVQQICTDQLPCCVLEIGVFKGQVISLWGLLAKKLNIELKITGITPLTGNKKPNKLMSFFRYKLSPKFREDLAAGNFYTEHDYFKIIKGLFHHFNLDFSKINLLKGYSTEQTIIDQVKGQLFSLIYIDGDHSYDAVLHDINTYASLVVKDGFLIMDDASCNLPGTVFWKGHQSVSDACEIIESLGFLNVINIGHNRVYRKM